MSTKVATQKIEVGQVFNRWEVVESSCPTPENIKTKRPFARCRCLDCGELKAVNIYDMVKGATKNCGCTRKKDITGQAINAWTVVRKTRFDRDTYYWCRCKCGTEKEIRGTELRSGGSKSCGCGWKISTVEEAKQKAIRIIRHGKYVDGDLPIDLFALLIQLPCFYCGRVGVNNQSIKGNSLHSEFVKEHAKMRWNGLDRFDRKIIRHDANNVVPSCPQCNFFKLDRSYEEMLANIPTLKENPQLLTADVLTKVHDQVKLLEAGLLEAKNPRAHSSLGKLYPEKYLCEGLRHMSYLSGTIRKFLGHRRDNPQYANVGKVLLTQMDLAELKVADCSYCGTQANLAANIASEVDRLDPSKGYSPQNCVPACRFCNSAKSTLSVEEFVSWIKLIRANLPNLPKTEKEVKNMIEGGYFIAQARELKVPDYFGFLK